MQNPLMGNPGDMSEMMKGMMNNPMMQQMMSNPDLMKQAAAMMGSGGNFDPNSMQQMMGNPSLKGLLSNPDFLNNAVQMMKDPRNKGMLDMMQQESPGMNMGLLIKAMDALVKCANAFHTVKRAWSNIIVRLTVFGMLVFLLAYYFN